MNAEDVVNEYKDLLPIPIIEEAKEEIKNRRIGAEKAKEIMERIKQEYENALIDPGEAIGIITAESFGEPSTQMSISRDEKIIVKIKNKIKILKIGEFVDKLMGLNKSYDFKDTEYLPLNDYDFYVPSINQEEKIEWKKVTECSRHKWKNKLLKLTTASGREIIATDNHSFVVREHNNVVPIVGRKFKISPSGGKRLFIKGENTFKTNS